jgi:hypothetical protein
VSRVLDELTALAKVQARREGRAVLLSHVLRVDPDPDALILAPVKMAGESRLWGVAIGQRGSRADFFFVPDARDRDAEAEHVIRPFAIALDEYFARCLKKERAPQVWVSSPAVARFLDALSERRGSRHDPFVALMGLRLHFLADRHLHAGQQVLLPATEVLGKHFATGQSPFEDQHLGSFLSWLKRDHNMPVERAAWEAEEFPAGVNTDVDFDYEASDLLTELAGLDKRSQKRRDVIARRIGDGLEVAATRIFTQIESAVDVLELQELKRVPEMDKLRKRDFDAFSFFMIRDFVPLRSSGHEAGRQLAARESAIDEAASVFLQLDPLQRTVALNGGEIVEGTVTDLVYGERAGSVHGLTFETNQMITTLRIGDTVRLDSTKRIMVQLIHQDPPQPSGARTMRFLVHHGKTFIEPYLNEEVALLPGGAGFFDRFKKPEASPWISDRKSSIPLVNGRKPPSDPIRQLDKLR